MPADRTCPECGVPVGETVGAVIDPKARSLPQLNHPLAVGNALVLLVGSLLLSSLLLVAGPVARRIDDIVDLSRPAEYWTPPWLPRAGGAVALLGLVAVIWLRPPRDAPEEVIRRDLWTLAAGLSVIGVSTVVDSFMPIQPEVLLGLLVVMGLILALLGLRGVLLVIGERSRMFRTARGGRQRVRDLIIAAAGLGLGLVLGELPERTPPALVGRLTAVVCGLMLLIGLLYLVVNAWWIRRSLRKPAPTLRELVGPP